MTASPWRALANRRMLICVLTGFSSGLPLYLLLNLLPAWLKTEGLSLKAIGAFALIQFPYTWKFIWSPFLDRYALPLLGRRRGWMGATQLLLLGTIAWLGTLSPTVDLGLVIGLTALIAFLSATQDIVLGCYYMTSERDYEQDLENGTLPKGWGKIFGSLEEVQLAYDMDVVDVQAAIQVRTDRDGGEEKLIDTTVGRAIFNLALPSSLGKYYNVTMDRKQVRKVVADCYRHFSDPFDTAAVVNDIKKVGFKYSTRGGMSIAVDDVTQSPEKAAMVGAAEEAVDKVERQYKRGLMTEDERLREIESIWNKCRDDLQTDIGHRLKGQNSVYMMADSGAKGNMNQISQMAGMRGLVLDPQGKIVEIPIKSNFREGLTVLEYFISTHGARKGLADTAAKLASKGYRTAAEMVLAEFPHAQRNKRGEYDKALSRVLLDQEFALLFEHQRRLGNAHASADFEARVRGDGRPRADPAPAAPPRVRARR